MLIPLSPLEPTFVLLENQNVHTYIINSLASRVTKELSVSFCCFLRFESEERLLLIEITWDKKQEFETLLRCRIDNDDVQSLSFSKDKTL